MVSRKAVVTLLVVHVAATLAAQTEAFVPIFTYGELQRMQERERSKGQRKSLSLHQRSEEAGSLDPEETLKEEENQMIQLTAPVEIRLRMISKQLEKNQAAPEGLRSKQPSDHASREKAAGSRCQPT